MYRIGVIAVAAAVVLGTPVWAQTQGPGQAAGQRKVAQACAADRKAYCADAKPGGGRIAACLQENADKLTAECHSALDAARAARAQQSH